MGRSAKLHKRVNKPNNVSSQPQPQQTTNRVQAQPVTRKAVSASSKKRKDLKSKARHANAKEELLGGADYVTLMLGGRRKAKEEAKKLPPPEGAMSSLSI